MNEQQIDILVEKILSRLKSESIICHDDQIESLKAPEKIAYIIMPEAITGKAAEKAMQCMEKCKDSYKLYLVMPRESSLSGAQFAKLATKVMYRTDPMTPLKEDICIFVSASRSLIARAALCIKEGFESSAAIRFIENGSKLFIFRSEDEQTGCEPEAYLRRIRSYEKDLASYGVIFDMYPECNNQLPLENGRHDWHHKRRVITAKEVERAGANGRLVVNPEDVFTDLAMERVNELNVAINRC